MSLHSFNNNTGTSLSGVPNTQPTSAGLWNNNGALTWFDGINNVPVQLDPDTWTSSNW